MSLVFLDLDDILAIHERQIERFGGLARVRDIGLLESAIAQPRAQFGGEFLHEDPHAMAAAYLYHIVRNHPFLDGNKRTGFIVAAVFLALNGAGRIAPSAAVEEMTLAVAEGRLGKAELKQRLSQLTKE